MRRIVLSVILLWSYDCLGNTVHVPGDFATIQAGINGATTGDTVLVAQGTYTENVDFSGKAILLLSAGGRDVTFIEPADPDDDIVSFVNGEDTLSVIDGFTIRYSTDGYGVYCENADPIIRNCDVSYCNRPGRQYGAGFMCLYSGAKIRNNRIHHNAGNNVGGGLAAYGDHEEVLEILGNEIYNNTAANGPGLGFTPGARNTLIARNVLWYNSGSESFPGAIYTSGQGFTILNNTVVSNAEGIVVFDGSDIDIRNNIVCSNTYEGLVPGNAAYDYNDVWNNGSANNPGPNGISADPVFVDAASHDYTLQANSPCIEAGDPDPQYNDEDGTRNDMGAFPFAFDLPLAIAINFGPDADGFLVNTLTPEIFWSYFDSMPTTQAQFEVEVGTDEDWTVAELWSTGTVYSSDTSVVYAGLPLTDRTRYYLRIRLSDGANWGSWRNQSFITRLVPILVNVPADYGTIQMAIDSTWDEDTILVAPGTYTEHVDYRGKALLVISSGGRDVTFIESTAYAIPLVLFDYAEDTNSVLDGFTLRYADNAPGIICSEAGPIIRNCDISYCQENGDGGGLQFWSSAAKIRNNRIHDNISGVTGGGIFVSGSSTVGELEFSGNEIFDNLAQHGPGIGCISVDGGITIARNVIRDNPGDGDRSAGIYISGDGVQILNNTIVGNEAGIMILSGFSTNIRNNIVASNNDEGIVAAAATLDYNDVWDNGSLNVGGLNGISEDPKFTNPALDDYTLQEISPCINAGDPDPQYNDPDGSRNDIGALVFLFSTPLATGINYGPGSEEGVVGTLTPEVFWIYTDTLPTTQAQFELEVGTDNDWSVAEMWSTGPVSSSDTSIVYAGSVLTDRTTYYLRIRVNDGANWGSWQPSTFYIRLFAATVNVPADYATIQAAIDQVWNGDTVLVAPGTYSENIDFLGKGICLTSVAGPDVTFIEAVEQDVPIVSFVTGEDTTAIIEGFTIRDASSSPGILCDQSSPTIRNCEITSCTHADDGGGIHCMNSGARIHDNKIHGNYAGDMGGGIYVKGTSSRTLEILRNEVFENQGRHGSGIGCYAVENVLIAYNSVWGNADVTAVKYAAGIYLFGLNSSIHNNTVVGNVVRGIKVIDGAGVEIKNNIVAMNVLEGIFTSDATSDYNNVWLNGTLDYPGPNGVIADPLFTDTASHDYTLQPSSPCIDAGDPGLQYVDEDGSRSDIGAAPILSLTLPVAAAINAGPAADGYFVYTPSLEVFWSYFDSLPTSQEQFELEAGTDDNWDVAELWSTGQVSSPDTSVVYDGPALANLDECYVRIRVNDGTNWGSWNSAYFVVRTTPATIDVPGRFAGIQYALDRALDDDTILVGPGTYVENLSFKGKRVLLHSVGGRDATFVEPAIDYYPVVNFSNGEGPDCIIDGFTIGNTTDAHGIECVGTSPTIRNCDVSFCHTTGNGGGVYCLNSAPKITGNRIHDNESGQAGAGIYISGFIEGDVIEIAGNEIYDNTSPDGEGIWANTQYLWICRNLIRDNEGWGESAGGVVIAGANFFVLNNTIVGNNAGIRITGSGGTGSDIRNNVVVSNAGAGVLPNGADYEFNTVWNNMSYNNPGRYGISKDPLFVDPASNDYSLQTLSPCIDAGDPDLQFLDADGSQNDMGAFPLLSETLPAAAAINFGPASDYWHYVYTTTPDIFWSFYDSLATTQHQYEIEVGTDEDWTVAEMWATGPVSSSDTSVAYGGSPLDDGGKYYVRIRVNNGSMWGSWRSNWFLVRTVPFTMNVPATIPDIQEALDWAVDGDTILVADGEFYGDGYRDLDFQGKGVLLVSENGPEATIIYCSSSITRESRAFVFTNNEDSTTVVQGFTLRNGNAYQGGAIYCLGASPMFVDCIVDSGRASTFGGAAYCDDSSPIFTRCVFRDNESIYHGGAIYCENSSYLRLTGCTLSGNRSGSESPVISGSGAGIYCIGSSLQADGCSFIANWAMNGSAGVWCQESSVYVHGCLFLDNISRLSIDVPQEYPLGGGLGLEDCLSSSVDSSLFAGNSCGLSGGALGYSGSTGTVTSCTFADNFCDSSGSAIGGLGGGSTIVVENSIIALNPGSEAVGLVGDITLVCCDVYGNGGDWVGGIAGQQGTNGNFSENPVFCGAHTGDYSLGEGSPCLPDGNSCGVLVGMLGLGCSYVCGDVDYSGGVDIDDVVYLVNYIFLGGEPPAPLEVADVDCSGGVDIDDAVFLVQFIFAGGNAPCDINGDGSPDC